MTLDAYSGPRTAAVVLPFPSQRARPPRPPAAGPPVADLADMIRRHFDVLVEAFIADLDAYVGGDDAA